MKKPDGRVLALGVAWMLAVAAPGALAMVPPHAAAAASSGSPGAGGAAGAGAAPAPAGSGSAPGVLLTGSGGAGAQRNRPLTAAEQAQQQRIVDAANAWRAQLAAVAAVARRQNDLALLAFLAAVEARLQQAAAAPATAAGFLATVDAAAQALDLWTGETPAVSGAEQAPWDEAEDGVSGLITAEDTGFMVAANLTSGQRWSYVPSGEDGGGGGDGGDGESAGGGEDVAGPGGMDALPAGGGEDVGGSSAAALSAGGLPAFAPEAPAAGGLSIELSLASGEDGMPDRSGSGMLSGAGASPGAGAGWIVVRGNGAADGPGAEADLPSAAELAAALASRTPLGAEGARISNAAEGARMSNAAEGANAFHVADGARTGDGAEDGLAVFAEAEPAGFADAEDAEEYAWLSAGGETGLGLGAGQLCRPWVPAPGACLVLPPALPPAAPP